MFFNTDQAESAALSPDDYGAAVIMAASLPDDADLSDAPGLIARLAGKFPARQIDALLPLAIARARDFRIAFGIDIGNIAALVALMIGGYFLLCLGAVLDAQTHAAFAATSMPLFSNADAMLAFARAAIVALGGGAALATLLFAVHIARLADARLRRQQRDAELARRIDAMSAPPPAIDRRMRGACRRGDRFIAPLASRARLEH